MQVDDEIAHVSVVDGVLRLGLPGHIGGGIVRVDADDLDLVEVLEFGAVQLGEFAAEHEGGQLFGRFGVGHYEILRNSPGCGLRRHYTVSDVEPEFTRTRAGGRASDR